MKNNIFIIKSKKKNYYTLIITLNIENVRITFIDYKGNVILKRSNSKEGSSRLTTADNFLEIIQEIKQLNINKINILFNGTDRSKTEIKKVLKKERMKIHSFIQATKLMHNGPRKPKRSKK
jgi:ribosomal protein S11